MHNSGKGYSFCMLLLEWSNVTLIDAYSIDVIWSVLWRYLLGDRINIWLLKFSAVAFLKSLWRSSLNSYITHRKVWHWSWWANYLQLFYCELL